MIMNFADCDRFASDRSELFSATTEDPFYILYPARHQMTTFLAAFEGNEAISTSKKNKPQPEASSKYNQANENFNFTSKKALLSSRYLLASFVIFR